MAVFGLRPGGRGVTAYVLAENSGVILGKVFPRGRPLQPGDLRISAQQALTYRASGGRLLLQDYWGAYVALLRAADGRRACVIRDPSGHIPSYVTAFERVTVAFADVEDLTDLGLPAFTMDWDEVGAFIRRQAVHGSRCALTEIRELLAGDCWQITHGCARQFPLWNPAEASEARRLEKHGEAIAELKRVCEDCIGAWSSAFDRILISLSGGFDSAVVLGCLRGATNRGAVFCVNDLYSDPRSDERRYARSAAAAAGVQLIERTLDADDHLLSDRLFATPRTVKPALQYLASALRVESSRSIAQQVRPDCMWTGEGGDHAFFQFDTVLTASDYFAGHGLGPRLLRVLGDTARLTRKSFLSVVRESWAARGQAQCIHREDEEGGAKQFLSADLLARSGELEPPRLPRLDDLPPGKQLQILYLLDVMNRHRPLPGVDCFPQLNPLLSQPVLEVCLQIPTYCLAYGGRRRGLAREAFRSVVPPEILARETKGSAGLFVMDILRRSQKFLREHLLDGILIQQGVLERAALERCLARPEAFSITDCRPLLACVAAEIWARGWATAPKQPD